MAYKATKVAKHFGMPVETCPTLGAEFLTEPKDHGTEIRSYMKDPDGHLIEVGQATGILDQS